MDVEGEVVPVLAVPRLQGQLEPELFIALDGHLEGDLGLFIELNEVVDGPLVSNGEQLNVRSTPCLQTKR